MALGDGISSDMVSKLLQNAKKGTTSVSEKKDADAKIDAILKQLKMIMTDMDPDSLEAKENREVLIKDLMKAFDKAGMSLKAQKGMLTSIYYEIGDRADGIIDSIETNLVNLHVSLMAQIPTAVSNVIHSMLTSTAFMTGVATGIVSAMAEHMKDLVPKLGGGQTLIAIEYIKEECKKIEMTSSKIVDISNSIYFATMNYMRKKQAQDMAMLAAINKRISHLGSTIKNYLKEKFMSIASSVKETVAGGYKNIMNSLKNITTSILDTGNTTINAIIGIGVGIIFWIFTTIVPMIFTVIGFLAFTVMPLLFSIFFEMVGFFVFTVIPTILGIGVGLATLSAALLPVILISLLVGVVLIVLLYYVVKLWKYIQGWAEDFYHKYLEGFSWDKLVKLFTDAKTYLTDTLWPQIQGLWNSAKKAWDEYIVPAAKWIWENLKYQFENKDSLLHLFIDQVNILVPRWIQFFNWVDETLKSSIGYMRENFPALTSFWDRFWNGWQVLVPFFTDKIISGVGALFGWHSKENYDPITEGVNVNAATMKEYYENYGIDTGGRKQLAAGGIITTPTNATIGEAGDPEAVIPLNEQGASFLRKAFFNDFASMISPKDLDTIREVPQNVLDIKEMEKMIQETIDDGMKKKFEMVLALLKEIKEKKSDHTQSLGGSSPDPFNDLMKAIATGAIGYR